ncbi:MAG: ribonuclease III [Gammaproteobacteria bacterium]|nr:ribonuclease III [Gammaproteobacteria bacterium]
MMPPLERLLDALGHHFATPRYLEEALSHRSIGSHNNERLEFLGDAVLSMVITAELYRRFTHVDEGQLSRMRAALVKGDNLAAMARDLHLGDYLRLGPGELKSGGFRRDSILADSFEAVIGAIYLDAGIVVCEAFIQRHFADQLEAMNPLQAGKDPKTRLQELLQSRHQPLPRYEVVATDGDAHRQVFQISCEVAMLAEAVTASSNSRRKAEQIAAAKALELIQHG